MSTDQAPGGQESATPLLRIVRGNPSAAEVAALVTVVSAIGAASGPSVEPADTSHWSAPARLHRPPVFPGNAGNWWASGLPR